MTYDELSQRAWLLARRLRELGVAPGDLVGQCVGRSAGLAVAGLGVMRAGAAFVAIDPGYPDERIEWMLADSGAVAVVADEPSAARLAEPVGRPLVVLGDGGQLPGWAQTDACEPVPTPGDEAAAYVVYTSGSTGHPKGVVLEHAGLANLIDWHLEAFGLGPADRCTQIASPGFDAAVWEIWPALAAGACIHIVPRQLRADAARLRDWLLAEEITVSFLPTPLAEELVGLSWPDPGALRFVLTGGDALARRPPADLGFILVNNYGLSETTVVATSGAVCPDGGGAPSIGRPIPGVSIEVVDERLDPVAPGIAGELLVGGAALARGYLNRPELTAERFLDGPSGRRYRTGDSVRLRDDGELEFLGRIDGQLSIRGFRVEPGEVAVALNAHPAVATSAVVGAGRSSSDRRLVAYLVAKDGLRPDPVELAAFAGRFLPEYMVPSRYIWLDALPVTAHGKLDREALPDPFAVMPAPGNGATEAEAEIAAVIAELLEIQHVGRDENFFMLGGHSMLGAQLIGRLESAYDVEISLRFLFDHPTAAELAREVQAQVSDRP